MVIQRIYIQPPPEADTQADATNAAVAAALQAPSLLQRSGTSDSDKAALATTLDTQAPQGSAPAVSLKRTPSASTSRTVSRLLSQHTGGSMASELAPGAIGSSRPSSPLDGLRAPTMSSVLKPSDFAKRKAAFMKPAENTTKFHAELERRYSNAPAPLEVKELSQKNDAPGRGTFIIPKLRSASGHSPASSSLLTPTKITTSTLSSSPERSPVELVTPTTPLSPKVEIQVIELHQRLIDSTVENKTLAAEITNMEHQMLSLKDKQEVGVASIVVDPPSATERHVPKEEFDALVKDTEQKTKELEEVERRAEESRKQLEALTAQAAKLLTKEKAVEAKAVQPAADQQNLAAKESLEKAVERLREQVEVATRQSSEVVSRRMSSSSRVSERYAPSTTRVPLTRNRRANQSEAGTPPVEKLQFDDTKTITSITSGNTKRHSQVIHIAPAEPLPERDDLQRSIKSYYTESLRSPSSIRPSTPSFLPPISQSDNDGLSTEALSRDMTAIMEGFSSETFSPTLLSLNPPPLPVARPRPSVSQSVRPMSTLSPAAKAPSIRSKHSNASLRVTPGKKKGWISLFKVKLPGGSSDDNHRSNASEKAPTLAPISKSSPISFTP